jgi:hypothetical protein
MHRQRGISDAGGAAEHAFIVAAHVGGGQLTGIPLGTAVNVFSYDQLEHGRALIAGPVGGYARSAGLRVIRQAGSVFRPAAARQSLIADGWRVLEQRADTVTRSAIQDPR